jgi:pimeloyl-ACP methyl ester carboxylesterase
MTSHEQPIVDADIILSDGRRLAYAVWGDPHGAPVFLFHGAPGSRFFTPDPATATAAGVRLITVDRPGYGHSDPAPDREILDWTNDIGQLADTLQAPGFAVLAHSSGGPYALACAARLPDRVFNVALISSVAPYPEPATRPASEPDHALTQLAREDPQRAAAQIAEQTAWLVNNPDHFLDLPRPEPDLRLLADQHTRSMFLDTIRESVRQGITAYAWDCVLERRPWRFALADVHTEVFIWHGEQDRAVPPAQADTLHKALPRSHLKRVENAGHGLILASATEILSLLTSTPSP